MKKFLAILLALVMVLSMAACGGSNGANENTAENENNAGNGEAAATGDSIRLVNGKVEVDAQLKKLAQMYFEKTGVTVEIESLGGGVDTTATLKGYYQADNMPDIFVSGSASDFATWEGMLVDMSGEAWAADTDSAYVDETYGTIGFPYTVEAIGLAYNADILAKAEIDPSTLNTPEAIEAAFAKLDSMKEELGLTAVVGYCAEATNLFWSTGNHLFGNYLDSGLAVDDTTYIDLLNDGGKLDTERMTNFANFVVMMQGYSDPSLLVSGTYDQQILNFTEGEYAFVTQGSWVGASMTNDYADAYAAAGNFKVGMIPYAFQEGCDTILTASPSWWAVYNKGNVEAAKAFLQWCSEAEAQEILVGEAGFVSPFKSCTTVATDPFAATIMEWQAAGKTSAWHWLSMVNNLAQDYTGQAFMDLAAGNLDAESFVTVMGQLCATAYGE